MSEKIVFQFAHPSILDDKRILEIVNNGAPEEDDRLENQLSEDELEIALAGYRQLLNAQLVEDMDVMQQLVNSFATFLHDLGKKLKGE